MHRGIALALAALLGYGMTVAAKADEVHRLYDRQTDCAVFDTQSFAAERANWDGPCTHGLASGRGTATYFARDGRALTISAQFAGGSVADGKGALDWSDGAHYAGDVVGGMPNGAGVLVDAKANRFDGTWKDGRLDGHGSAQWSNGDRYDGDWVAGKAEGHGVQLWADGRKYDGAWHNDQPNGQGTLTRKDGTSLAGLFVDGKRQAPAATEPAGAAATTPKAADAAPASLLDAFAGKTLIGVDGSTIAFADERGQLIRTLTTADGTVRKAAFVLAGPGLGTISDAGDPPKVDGVFRQTPAGLVVEYADGRSETLSPMADGLSLVANDPSGAQACAAWYPKGHVFSVLERQAAVAAYAARLGVGPAPAANGCATPAALPVNTHRAPPAPRKRGGRAPPQASLPAPPIAGLEPVPVKDSTVHLVDPAPRDAIDTGIAATADEPIASNCLKVDSDGAYWGFRNHCGYAVQFAYCLLHGTDRMTACGSEGAVSVSGSVSANGFGALFADDSLGERDVDHAFRWIGCKGGAGEVAAHLDSAEPASGHCVRSGRTLARDN